MRNKVEWPPTASEVMEVKFESPRSNGMICIEDIEIAVKLLLDHINIDLNAKSNNGRTAFMLACMKGHHNVVKLQLRLTSDL